VRVHVCPVRFYFERDKPVLESDRHVICKQLSYHPGKNFDAGAIWEKVLEVRPNIDTRLRGFMDACIASCEKNGWNPDGERDVPVASERHGITGVIDRMEPVGTFSIIRASGAMPFGTYAADRLQIAAIAMCLEEMTGKEVLGGNIEYIPDGVSRFHEVQPRDRKAVITTLHTLQKIKEGQMPVRPLNAPCNRCKYKEKCEEACGHRLSELL